MSEPTRALLTGFPSDAEQQMDRLQEIARNEEIALRLLRLFGANATALDEWFLSLVPGCDGLAKLTRDRKGEIVYHDPGLASAGRRFQTIPELAAMLRHGGPATRLPKFELVHWRLRLLHDAGLIELPAVAIPVLRGPFPPFVHAARDGFEMLFRCRTFLRTDVHEGVPYTRSFVEGWCGLGELQARQAIEVLIAQRVIVKRSETESKYGRMNLYVPGKPDEAASTPGSLPRTELG